MSIKKRFLFGAVFFMLAQVFFASPLVVATENSFVSYDTVLAAGEEDAYEDLLGQIDKGLVTRQTTKAGILKGVTTACFEYGQCTVCDMLIVFIEVSNVILLLFAILALLFFVYGAGYLMFSSGNEQMVTKGKGVIKATIIGSVIVLIAWQLMAYVTIILANGSVFDGTEDGGLTTPNPVAGWYNVASRCGSENLRQNDSR
jgi:hypothetical protein